MKNLQREKEKQQERKQHGQRKIWIEKDRKRTTKTFKDRDEERRIEKERQ